MIRDYYTVIIGLDQDLQRLCEIIGSSPIMTVFGGFFNTLALYPLPTYPLPRGGAKPKTPFIE